MSSSPTARSSARPSETEPQDIEKANVTTNASATCLDENSSASFWDKLPTWISSNLRSQKSLKLLARCWIASWVSFIILLPNKSVRTLGNAAFFTLITSLMMPPNMPLQIFVFVLLTIALGVLLGWGLGAAAMRAALAVRDQAVVKATLQKEAQSAAGLANVDALFEAAIFNGDFLDTRCSVLFGVFLGVSTFGFALVRAYMPRLIIMSVFATIAMDIFCSYGPLFPFAQYTLLNSLLESLACYVGIGLILIIVVFPETLNHALLVSTADLVGELQALVEMQGEVLGAAPSDLTTGSGLLRKVLLARDGIFAHIQQFSGQLMFLNLEFSWGKWNGDDIKELEKPLAGVVSRIGSLQTFVKLMGHPTVASANPSSTSLPDISDKEDAPSILGDTHLFRQLQERHLAAEVEHSVRLVDVLPVIKDATIELREACIDSLACLQAVIHSVNKKRYVRDSAADTAARTVELEQSSARLRVALDEFRDTKRLLLVEPFRPVLELAQSQKDVPLRSLYIAYVFAANLMAVGTAILSLVEVVAATARRRKRNKLWVPKGLRMIGKVLTSRDHSSEQAVGEDAVPAAADKDVEKEERSYRLDPDSKPPANVVQKFAHFLHTIYAWSKTAEAMYAFKYAFISIALWLPSVFKSSAHFNYAERGVWALIMAQTTLNIYVSDQIWNYVTRLIGTFIGLIIGLLCWYIGSAKSIGSPYGMAASVGVFLIPNLFLRLFAPLQYLPAVMMIGTTWGLIVGYSWLDGHIAQVGNVGIGWSVAWRRWVLVLIGSLASFIVMIFPPTSGRKAVRLRNASTVAELSYIYSHLMSAWINDEEPADDQKEKGDSLTSAEWIPEFRHKLIAVAQQLQALRTQTAVAKWEGSIRGAWPFEEYLNLLNIQSDMVGNLALLGGSLAQVDRGTRVAFLQHTKVVNPNFISDVMATFLLVSQSLRTGEPLHQTHSQHLLDRLLYHGDVSKPSFPTDDQNAAHTARLQSVTSYEYMFYASGIVAVFQLLRVRKLRRFFT
ncbi:hypothetical protein AcW1_010001 [Taiwanofungus camphoratus]|nr:hypothetical protein AcW1_010001 [Antrodia cinnamomea]